jgi:DUF2934 family protein
MTDRNHHVRERAYYLWEAEGRPEGRAEMHWIMAEIATTLFGYLDAPGKASDDRPCTSTIGIKPDPRG